jgi:hypothetical protein
MKNAQRWMAGVFVGSLAAGASLVSAQYVQPVPGAGMNKAQPKAQFPAGTRDINVNELQTVVNNLNRTIDILSTETPDTSGNRQRALQNASKARDAIQREINEAQRQATDKEIDALHQRDKQARKLTANEYYPGLQQAMQYLQNAQQTLMQERNDSKDRRQHALEFLQTAVSDLQKETADYVKAHPEVVNAAPPAAVPAAAVTPGAPAAANAAAMNAALVPGTGQQMKASDGPLSNQLQRILDHIDNSLDTLSRQPEDKAGHHKQAIQVLQQAREHVVQEMQELGIKPQG